MVSLFEVCPGKTGSQFPCPDPRALQPSPFAARLPSTGESAESFSNEPLAFNAFSRGLLSVETATSGLEFTGNNTGDSPRLPGNARRDKVSRRRDAFACLPLSVSVSVSLSSSFPPRFSSFLFSSSLPQLLNCQSQPEVSARFARLQPRRRCRVSSRLDASTRDIHG